jgi:hypothetical protein
MANYEEGFSPNQSASKVQYEDGFTPHPIQPIQEPSFLQNLGQYASSLGSNAAGFGKSAAAAIASGAQDFANGIGNSLSFAPLTDSRITQGLSPQAQAKIASLIQAHGTPQDNTDYFKMLGANRNAATDIGQGLVGSLPYMVAPEAAIPELGLAGRGIASLLGRAGIRGASGVAQQENQNPNASAGDDATNAAIYALTGGLSDILPLKAAQLVDMMHGTKLADQMIQEGNRANLFPDVGNIVGSPKGMEKWNNTVAAYGSPARDIQERSLVETPNNQYSAIQDADKKTNELYDKLTGGQEIHPAVSQDIQKNYAALKKQGDDMYKEINPTIKEEKISEHPNATVAAQDILNEQKENQLAGVIDPNVKSNIVLRAQNALKMAEGKSAAPEAEGVASLLESKTPADGANEPVSLDSKIKEERALSGMAADLRGRGDNSTARYYSNLSNAHAADIDAHLQANNPELLGKIQDARDFYKNNVIPYNESSVIRKVLNNNFDEEVSPLTLTNRLTDGTHDQLLSTLPQGTKNKLVADMLFNKTQNALGQVEHPSIDLASSIESVKPSRLNKILPKDDPTREALSDIYSAAKANKGALNDVSRSTQTLSSAGGPNAVDVAHAVHNPASIGAILGKIADAPTAPYWTKFLSNEENPTLLDKIRDSQKVNTANVRQMTQPDTAGASIRDILSLDPRTVITNILSRPNYLRAPIVGTKQGIEENKRRNQNG